MRKIILIYALAAALLCFAQGPQLEFSQREVDLGYFDADSVQTASFTLKNTGCDTLVILRVHTECRCTRPGNYKNTIAPGDSARLDVTYNGKGHAPGRIRQAVRLRTNVADDPYSTCYITGRINRPLRK